MTKRELRWLSIAVLAALVLLWFTSGPAMGQVKVTNANELAKALANRQVAELPAGTIEIRDTLVITRTNGGGIRGLAAGSLFQTAEPGAASHIAWAGEAGKDMILVDRALGLDFSRFTLDGRGKARNGVKFIDAWWGNAGHQVQSVNVRNVTGAAFEFGESAGDPNCSDVVFINVGVFNCQANIRALNHQAVNFLWLGGMTFWVKTPFDFQRGGNLTVTGGHYGACDTILFVGEGGPNVGGFTLRDLRFEMSGYSRRFGTWVNAPAPGGATIVLDHCQETDAPIRWDWPDDAAPLFQLGSSASLRATNYRKRFDRAIVSGEGVLSHDNSAWTPTIKTEVKWTR